MSGGQLEFPVISDAEVWRRMLEEIRDTCRADSRGGLKQAAFDLDLSPSELSNALNERDRHDLKIKQLPYFLRRRLTDELPRLIVEACDLRLGEARPLTAAEKLSRLEEALTRAGAAGEAILADAYGRRR